MVSLVLHSIILVLAILIKDIGDVFDFAGTIGCSFIMYFFPAIGFLLALSRFGKKHKRTWRTKAYQVLAWVFIIIGTAAVGSYIFSTTLKIMGKMPQPTKQN